MEARLSFDDKHEIIYTYAADGRKLRAEYRINNFAVVDRDDEFGEMDDIGLPLSDVATFGLRDTMVAGGGIIDNPDVPPFTTLTTRDYCGNYIYRNGTLERILTPTGYIEGDTLHHYIKDYQGNVRCVVRHDGTLVESNEYYPYGGLFSATASTQPNKYGAKELDRTNGLDLYDSEARWYDSLLGRTTTMDPLAEKYYSISPYAWCAGNPMKYVDRDGEILEFAEGSTQEFKQYFFEAVCYMILHGTADNIAHIINSGNVYIIQETTGSGNEGNRFESSTATIFWNPSQGITTTNNNCLSPTTMLDHEAQHCVNYDMNPQQFKDDLNTYNEDYGSIEEKNVIENRETQTAIKHGEIRDGEFSRYDHYGGTFKTNNPTQNFERGPMSAFFYILWRR